MMTTTQLARIQIYMMVPNTKVLIITRNPMQVIKQLQDTFGVRSKRMYSFSWGSGSYLEVRKISSDQDALNMAGREFDTLYYLDEAAEALTEFQKEYLKTTVRSATRGTEVIKDG